MGASSVSNDFNDLAKEKGNRAVAAAIKNAVPPAAVDVDAWPEIAVPWRQSAPPLTPNLLPSWAGDMAEAVAHSTETPPDMATLFVLALIALCVQGRFVVAPKGDDYTEPLALWVLIAMQSGSRKSAVRNLLMRVIDDWMKHERAAMLKAVIARGHEIQAADALIERKQRDLARLDDAAERKRLLVELAQLEHDKPAPLHFPDLYGTEPTTEAIAQKLVEQAERFGVISTEAAALTIWGGLYSGKGRANVDVVLCGHAGDTVIVNRAGRPPLFISRALLTVALAAQPDILFEMFENSQFRGSGLIARFLMALPASNIGKRDVRRSAAIDPGIKARYEAGMLGLLRDRPHLAVDPVRLEFTDPAREAWFEFAEQVEHDMGDGRRFESIRDWAGKLPGAVARMAALIEIAECGGADDGVSLQAVECAIELGRRLAEHALVMFGMVGANQRDADALAILRWVKANDLRQFDRTELYRAHEARFGGNTERAADAIKRLVGWHCVRHERVKPPPGSKGGRPRDLCIVSPRVFAS